jgi:hypothetical protein
MKTRVGTLRIAVAAAICLPVLLMGAPTEKKRPESVGRPVEIDKINSARRARCLTYLANHGRPPVDYVVEKFKTHDTVLLGETHEVRENCQFVSDLIEPLYRRAGVRVLATEFVRSRNNSLVNKLITANVYDDKLAIRIFRDYGWPTWGFKEYIDILKAAWALNSKLSPKQEKVQVVGLDSNWSQYDLIFKTRDQASRSRTFLLREKHMVSVFEQTVLEKSRKALVHLGFAHSITCHGQRFGTVLRKKYGKRVFQVCLHHQLGKKLMEFLELLFAQRDDRAVGFDVLDSPFANLRDDTSPYSKFLKAAVFSQFAEGYIFLKPISRLQKITWVKGFIDVSNFRQARAIAVKLKWLKRRQCTTPKELDKRMKQLFEKREPAAAETRR